MLVWIGAKLLLEDNQNEKVEAAASFWPAVKTIIMADLIMSLDNTLAIAAIADGNYVLLILGLVLSVPLIICGSQLLVKVMNKFPVIVYVGAGLIAWTAGEMMVRDQRIGVMITANIASWILPTIITVGVVGIGLWHNYRKTSTTSVENSAQ
jgi:predicted tellurium resistance membrane protein TerC